MNRIELLQPYPTITEGPSVPINGKPHAICPCVVEARRRARAELRAFDVFANSTAHEEYRPS